MRFAQNENVKVPDGDFVLHCPSDRCQESEAHHPSVCGERKVKLAPYLAQWIGTAHRMLVKT